MSTKVQSQVKKPAAKAPIAKQAAAATKQVPAAKKRKYIIEEDVSESETLASLVKGMCWKKQRL